MISGIEESSELIATLSPSFLAISRNGRITRITLITFIFCKLFPYFTGVRLIVAKITIMKSKSI